MPLINCPDCGREVSSNAASCPHCAAPICGQAKKNVVTIEKTSKPIKGAQAAGCLTVILGIIMMGIGSSKFFSGLGFLLFLAGFMTILVSIFARWWRHD